MGIARKLQLGVALAVLAFQGLALATDGFHGEICAKDKDSVECSTAKALIRRNHPDLLTHGRDKTMRQGVRARNAAGDPVRFSIRGCVSCHIEKDKETGQYPKITSEKHFCAGCHKAAAVTLDCFECHSSKPDAVTLKRLGIGEKDGHDHATHSHEAVGVMPSTEKKVDFKGMAKKTVAAISALFNGSHSDNGGHAHSATLEGILFESGSAVLLSGSKDVLNQVATVLKTNQNAIEIAGFSDNSGEAKANLVLSTQRATAVRDYLVAQGVAAARIVAKGYGDANPIADNTTAIGRKQNRRVELKKL